MGGVINELVIVNDVTPWCLVDVITFTRVANDVLLQGQLPRRAVVHILQGDTQLMHDVLRASRPALPWTAKTAPTSEKHVKDVHGTGEAWSATSSFFNALLSMLIVNTSFLRVGQALVGHRDLFKLFSGLWATVFIWVVLEGQLSVGLLEVTVTSAGLDAQQVVEFGFFHHVELCEGC